MTGKPRKQNPLAVDPIDGQIGANIKKARLALGLTMKDLGEMMDPPISYQQIDKYERGLNRTASSKLVAIAELLQLPVAALLTGVDIDKVMDYGDTTTAKFVKTYQSLPGEDGKAAIRNLVSAMAKEAASRFPSAKTTRTRPAR